MQIKKFSAEKITHFLGPLLLIGLIHFSTFYNYLLFHALVEIFSIIVIFTLFVVAWNSRRFIDNHYLLYVAIFYMAVGAIDLAHTLSYQGMGIFEGISAGVAIQAWIAARYLETFTLLTALFFISRRINPYLCFSIAFLIAAFLLSTIFYWEIFPECFIQGEGLTPFKVRSEYLICVILFFSALGLHYNRKNFNTRVLLFLYLAIGCTILAELVFTTYITLFERSNFIGHYLKLISCWFIYKAVVETGISEPNQLLYHKLQQSRELYRLLAENCGDIIWRMDQSGKAVYTSPGLKKLLGFEPEEAEERFNEASRRELQNVFQEMKNAEDRKERLIELNETTKNGREIYTETSLSPVYSGSEFDGVVAVTRDITERKRFEEYLHNLIQEQQELNLRQKEFNACLTHELRTPLSGIIGLIDIAVEAYPDKKCFDYLSDLSLSTSHMHSLVNNVLDLSKLENGSFQIHHDICSLKDLISFLDKNITPSLNRQVDFKIDVSEDVPDFIKTDALRLRQILLNLLNNSAKFTEKGRVELVIRLKKAGVLFFEISDTGPGIPPEVIDNIFTKYCSLCQSGQKKGSPGTGLGLYIAHALSALMGEAVKVDSELGRGSRFYFSINFESVSQEMLETEIVEMPEEEDSDFVPLKILAAEDERINRMVLEKILLSCGHDVVMVNNGEELLDKLREKSNFDLIMTDIEMPVIDGIELTKRIRQCTDGSFEADIPIIAMTAHSSEEVLLTLREIGVTEVFTKPHNLEQIMYFLQKYKKKAT